MQPPIETKLNEYGDVIVDSFKNTCRSQSSTYREFTMLPTDKRFVRKMYTDPQTHTPFEYILCVDELFTSIPKISLESLNGEELRNFRIITERIRLRVQADFETEMLLKICEPDFKDPTTSVIFCWYAYNYAKIAGLQNRRPRL